MAEWRELSLRDAGVALIDCDHRTPAAIPTGYPYVAIPQLSDGHIDVSTARRISLGDFESWTRKARPVPHDVVLSRRTNPGVTAYVPEGLEFALGQNLVLLRSDGQTVYPPFLRWLVQGPAWWRQIEQFLNVGAVFDSLKCADVPNFRLPIPPLAEQHRIARILGALDDKIDLNRRTTKTLEAMTRALFGRWFLRAETSRDWPIEPLAAHLEVVRGLSYKGDGLASTGVPLHNLNSVYEGGGYKPDGIKWYSGAYAERHTVEPGDVIVTNTEQGHDRLLIGHAALVPRSFGGLALFSHHLYRVRPRPGSVLSRWFVTYLLNSPAMHDLVSGYSNGTTVQMLPVEALQQPAIRIPPASLVRRFDALATISDQRQEIARGEARALAILRDALLPRLLSGSIEEMA